MVEDIELITGANSSFRFSAIGTQWVIDTPHLLNDEVREEIIHRIEVFDKTYSRFRADSLIREMAAAKQGGEFVFGDDCHQLFSFYDHLHLLTEGAVDPLVGQNLEWLGYNADYSLQPSGNYEELIKNRTHWSTDAIREGNKIKTTRPVVIDIGAAGKGYLVDIIGNILTSAGEWDFIIDAGGDILKRGIAPVRVGLEHPLQPQNVIGINEITNGSVCASATNRRRWSKDLHHILDARTAQPVRSVIATWVSADTALLADGLATALFFKGAPVLQASYTFSSVRMFSDCTVEVSPGFTGEIFYRRQSINSLTHFVQ